jgi:hypothetical protein
MQFADKTAKVIRMLGAGCLAAAMVLGAARAQQEPAGSSPQEFPVYLRQNVVAGQTPVGSKVEAKLVIATLVSGKVVPAGATLLGEVLASEAKTAGKPSRLAIRVDSARWKNDSVSLKAYLTAWYYPLRMAPEDRPASDRLSGIHGEATVTTGGAGSRPGAPAAVARPYPTPNTDENPASLPPVSLPPPITTLSDARVKMKDVESVALEGGGIAITSSRLNLKLDKTTTYVLATPDLPGNK